MTALQRDFKWAQREAKAERQRFLWSMRHQEYLDRYARIIAEDTGLSYEMARSVVEALDARDITFATFTRC